MEPLTKSLRDLGQRMTSMPAGLRLALGGVVALGVGIALAAAFLGGGSGYQYLFTNLTAKAAAEASAALKGTGTVVLNLQPGRSLAERELAGVRHLVASAVPGMSPDMVTVMDGRGMVLSGDRSESAKLASQQREVEGGLEQRIVELLEPAVGA